MIHVVVLLIVRPGPKSSLRGILATSAGIPFVETTYFGLQLYPHKQPVPVTSGVSIGNYLHYAR